MTQYGFTAFEKKQKKELKQISKVTRLDEGIEK